MSGATGDTEILPPDWHIAKGSAEQPAQASPSAVPEFTSSILKIIPDNERARKAFHELVKRKTENELHPHHAKFIVGNGMRLLERVLDKPTRDSEETTEDDECEPRIQDPTVLLDGVLSYHFAVLAIVQNKVDRGERFEEEVWRNGERRHSACRPGFKTYRQTGSNACNPGNASVVWNLAAACQPNFPVWPAA